VAATTTGHAEQTFATVPGDRRCEVARTLAEPVPQALSLLDQFGLWGNLGVSLLGTVPLALAGLPGAFIALPSWMSASILSFAVATGFRWRRR
jgi:hypothetical protein